ARPWPRLSVDDAFRRYSPLSLERSMADDCFEEMLVEHVEPKLGFVKPLFLYDYPVEMASLARKKPGDPNWAERFELYLHGVELANGYSELTDAGEQRQRFARELTRIEAMGGSHGGMPERFLADLERLPAAAGIALGVDRLFMLLAGYGEIGRAVPFGPDDF
ncbi:EF-P lysine aminoacylase GenX, partial [Desulfoprunum benzoelyticum]|nr:EF-P lysine aminoacylase GenX [Desulfoprunum benzoelyticum]